jgi:LacI family transcriptional regulator
MDELENTMDGSQADLNYFRDHVEGPETLHMVAERAQVSPSTVSRILNGTARVSEKKRIAVEKAISDLGFRPNPTARSLAGGKTMTIGVLTQYIDSPFYGAASRGIEDVLTEFGYAPIVTSGSWNPALERDRIKSLLDRKVDGLIVLTSQLSDKDLLDISRRVPLVVTGRNLRGENLTSINFDNFKSGQLAAQHLLNLGHTQLAVILGALNHADSDLRYQGILQELEARNVDIDPSLVVVGDYHESGGHRAMKQIISAGKPFSGVIALNDQMAFGAMLAMSQAGLRVPEDVSIVGMDNIAHSAFTTPPLSSVSQPIYEIGRATARSLLGAMAQRNWTESPSQSGYLGPELLARNSTRRLFR